MKITASEMALLENAVPFAMTELYNHLTVAAAWRDAGVSRGWLS